MMKKFKRFSDQLEAQMAAQLLRAHGIEAEVFGAKEYTSILLGSSIGSFDLLVPEEKFSQVAELLRQELLIANDEPLEMARPELYFKKAMLYSVFSLILLPVVFNYYSLKNLQHYLQVEKKPSSRRRVVFLILILQIPSLWMVFYLIRTALAAI